MTSFLRAGASLFGLALLIAYAPRTVAAEEDGISAASAAMLAESLAGDQRSAENKARDQFRHPAETLAFFGLEPNMSVVEIWPSGGWYTEVIAPYMKRGGGTYYAAGNDPNGASERTMQGIDAFNTKVSDPVYGDVKVVAFGPNVTDIVPPGSVDMVVSFRNLHNWMAAGWEDKAMADIFKALKPGGIFGLEDHRAGTDTPQDPKAPQGYVREDYAIAVAKKAGFVLVASSPVNDNAKDTKDHPFGVWTLPPTMRSSAFGKPDDASFDHAPYIAIGESDRFTLKFMKPAS